MIKLGRVSTETRGTPKKDDFYEDSRCVVPGNLIYIPPERCVG